MAEAGRILLQGPQLTLKNGTESKEPEQPVPKNAMNSLRDTGHLPTFSVVFLSAKQGDTVGPLVAKS